MIFLDHVVLNVYINIKQTNLGEEAHAVLYEGPRVFMRPPLIRDLGHSGARIILHYR